MFTWKKAGMLLVLMITAVHSAEAAPSFVKRLNNHIFTEGDLSVTVSPFLEHEDTDYLVEGNLIAYGSLLSDKVDFRLTARASFEESIGEEGDDATPYTTFDEVFQDTTQPYIDLREAYAEFGSENLKIRTGLQFFDWGQVDEWNITDLANTEDYRQFILRLEKDRKIGLPAVSVMKHFSTWNVQVFYAPTWIPYRLADIDERWFSGYARSLDEITAPSRLLPSVLRPLAPDGITMPLDLDTRNCDSPEWFDDYQTGARIRKDLGRSMVGLVYFYGYDPFPGFNGEARLVVPRTLELSDIMDQGRLEVTLFPEPHRISMVGMEFSTAVKKIALRGEAAYIKDRYYNRIIDADALADDQEYGSSVMNDFMEQYTQYPDAEVLYLSIDLPDLAKKTDVLQAGLQADYFWKELFFSVAGIYSHIYSPDPYMIVREDDLLALFLIYYTSFKWNLGIKGTVATHIEAGDSIALASVERTWKDVITTELGILSISGPENSLLGQFASNDQIFFKVSYRY